MTNAPVSGSNAEQKAAAPATPASPQQNQDNPKPAENQPSQQRK